MKNAPTHNTWQTLAAVTARALNEEQQSDGRRDDREPEQRSERGEEAHREYVEKRLRELSAFEARVNGGRKRR
jgi:hypothetical protein